MNLERPLFVNLPLAMEAFSSYPGNSIDRRVFADISQFANRQGRAFTTEKAIAARLGLRREEVSKSVNRLKEKGFLTITMAKKGLDRHPRNVYYIAKRFLRRHPDKRSPHYSAAAWKRWCEIGRKRAATIALRKKQAAQAAARTVRDTAAAMAGKRPTTANASQLTPAQAREARARRGGGFVGFGGVLAGLFPTASSAPTAPVVKDTYAADLKQRGELLQQLREHEAQPVPAPAPQAPADGTAGAWQEVARGYSRASRPTAASAYPADSSSPWPSSSTAPVQPIRQPATPPVVEQTADSADAYRETAKDKSYWLQRLRELKAQYAAESAAVTCETR